MASDFLSLAFGCIAAFAASQPGLFAVTVIAGVVLAALCWYFCTVYTHLWNRQYHVTIAHHALCAFASIFTLVFVIMFASFAYTKEVALSSIGLWQVQLNSNAVWGRATFAKAYNQVKDSGLEDFSSLPPLGSPDATIPVSHEESRQTAASIYANEACKNFDQTRPFLSKIVWSRAELPSQVVLEDIVQWLQTHPIYPTARAIELAAEQIKAGLNPQTPRVVQLSRIALAVFFLLIQAIPFGIIGWAAYVDIKARM